MTDAATLPWLILLLPLLSAAVILVFTRRSGNISAYISVGSVIATLILAGAFRNLEETESHAGDHPASEAGAVSAAADGNETKANDDAKGDGKLPFIDLGKTFRVSFGVTIDQLSKGMLLIVTIIGALVHIFSLGYMKDDEGKSRYFAGLSLFMFSMTGIVMADNFVMMFVFWELVGVSSYILIGHWFDKNSAADASKKAFITNRIGDFGFMIGILLVWCITKSFDFGDIETFLKDPANAGISSGLLAAAVLCVFMGAVGKSAQLPLHVWLPDAMEGPTPVSALIHAATMVAAGVYMLARVGFLIEASELAACVIAWVGALTALLAALMATQQNDIKRVLAYSTLSQLGYMVMAVGAGSPDAGMFHLYTHAFFKALLFLGAGAVIYACHHEQDIWKMGGLRKKMPITFLTFLIGTAALCAFPFITSGFWSKETVLVAAWNYNIFIFWIVAIVAVLTTFYMTRLVIVTFFGKPRDEGADHAREVPAVMWLPLALLAVMALGSAIPTISEGMSAMNPHGDSHAQAAESASSTTEAGNTDAVTPATSELAVEKPHPNDEVGHEEHGAGAVLIISIFTFVVGLIGAVFYYRGQDRDPIRIPLFANKFYIDEAYAGIVRFGQDLVATILSGIDKYLVDGVIARMPSVGALGIGNVLRRLQTGNLQHYAFLFSLGVIVVLYLVLNG
jgi:NADH-quinone oxidoreductase subunit L